MAIKKTIKTVWQIRRDITANWLLNKDTIPAAGEPCYDLELKTLKIGDGTTTYENLPVVGYSESGDNSALQAEIDAIKRSIEALQIDIDDVSENVSDVQEQVGDTAETVSTLETELKKYIDEQIRTVEPENIDDGEI